MKKILILFFAFAAFSLIFLMAIKLVDKISPSNYCIEDGDCYEGEKVWLGENEIIIINKENCLKHNWHWSEKRKMCKVDLEKIR